MLHGLCPVKDHAAWLRILDACPLAEGPFAPEARRCDWCGGGLGDGRRRRWCSDVCAAAFGENHVWSVVRAAALARDRYACTKCGAGRALEVNHRVPILGRHAVTGCHHHLDGVETLCHDCHVVVTAEQFGREPTGEQVARALGTVPLFDLP